MILYFLLLARVRANPVPGNLPWRAWAAWSFILAGHKHLRRRNISRALEQARAATTMALWGRT